MMLQPRRCRLLLLTLLLPLLPTNLAATSIVDPRPRRPIIVHLAAFVSSHGTRRSLIPAAPKHDPIVVDLTRCTSCSCYLSIPTLYDLEPLVLDDETRIAVPPVVDDRGGEINDPTQYLISPAPESYHLIERCVHEINDYFSCRSRDKLGTTKDDLLLQTFYWYDMEALVQYLVKPGYRLELFPVEKEQDVSFPGLLSSWRWNITVQDGNEKLLIHHNENTRPLDDPTTIGTSLTSSSSSSSSSSSHCNNRRELYQSSSALEIAKLAVKMSEYGDSATMSLPVTMEEIRRQLKKRLCLTLGSDLRGVTSAEAAFYLAISGVSKSHDIFDALVKIGIHELRRSGGRSSFRPKYILQMVEKFAASGIDDSMYTVELYHLAGTYLRDKKGHRHSEPLISHLLHGSFGLHSSRPLLWLWRYSARQRKVSSSFPMKQHHVMDDNGHGGNIENSMNIVWEDHFVDTNKGLVVDIGCGFGVCLLNLVRHSMRQNNIEQVLTTTDDLPPHLKWSEYNFAGADLNPQLIGYANGVTSRFPSSEQQNRLHFFSCSAQEMLQNLFLYRGNIECIMIHFPSPYRLPLFNDDCNDKDKERSGNRQLPDHGSKDGFMITPQVATMISTLLQNNPQGLLIFQTKCEDVAIHVKNLLLSTGTLETVPCCHPVKSVEDFYAMSGRRPKRLDLWLESTPEAERAEGDTWSSKAIMPTLARPETEIQCEHDHTVVHRCLFRSIQGREKKLNECKSI